MAGLQQEELEALVALPQEASVPNPPPQALDSLPRQQRLPPPLGVAPLEQRLPLQEDLGHPREHMPALGRHQPPHRHQHLECLLVRLPAYLVRHLPPPLLHHSGRLLLRPLADLVV